MSRNPLKKLGAEFYSRNTLLVARQLIGMHLVHDEGGLRRIGRIVETEAYLGPHDLAAHSAKGRTARTAVMFGPAGHAYVYLIYGCWNCFNVVTRREGVPQAVLVRALEPVLNVADKTWGPGLLCRAMDIDRSLNGADLTRSPLWVGKPRIFRRPPIATGTRIGVEYAGEWALHPWRFFDADSPYVSTVLPGARRRALAQRGTSTFFRQDTRRSSVAGFATES